MGSQWSLTALLLLTAASMAVGAGFGLWIGRQRARQLARAIRALEWVRDTTGETKIMRAVIGALGAIEAMAPHE